MIKGIGTDILSLSRLRGVIARRGAGKVARRILSDAEMGEFRALASGDGGKGGGKTGSVEEQTRFLGTR
jgi:phosphopantetheinyl transferase (holo-ACP synthase)